jgi:hypothetical protein
MIKMRRLFVLAVMLLVLGVGLTIATNQMFLGGPLSTTMQADTRNAGIAAHAHFGDYVNPSVLVFDLEDVSPQNSPMDVFRAFLQFSAAVKDQQYTRVELAHHGTTKFVITGEYFRQLGAEYGKQNPIYTIRPFPEHLQHADGTGAYGSWTGGMLGVLGKQMGDFNDFHRKWYLDDVVSR